VEYNPKTVTSKFIPFEGLQELRLQYLNGCAWPEDEEAKLLKFSRELKAVMPDVKVQTCNEDIGSSSIKHY
jgi:hypothetical protein